MENEMQKIFLSICVLSLVFIVGCGRLRVDLAISSYNKIAPTVHLGDSREVVLEKLTPTQKNIPSNARKPSESFKKDNDIYEIYYFRTGRQPDRLTTDDEFTPYVFKNGILESFGWTALGGPESRGQVIQPAPVHNQNVTIE
jgi:hypothetical protein